MQRSVEVILSPALQHLTVLDGKIVVVIDILRATTTICAALHRGAASVRPVADQETAYRAMDEGKLAGGERNGEKIPGFHLGNSPLEYSAQMVKGREIVLTTTNGTRCIELSKDACSVIAGAFVNIQALTGYLNTQKQDIVLFCAGWKDQINLEDSLFAGRMLELLQHNCRIEGDPARLLLRWANLDKDRAQTILQHASHVERFKRLGVQDLDYCLQEDLHPVVPILTDGLLRSHTLA